ncbi:hypothetical protein NW759_011038 [Fusarium solani]|nr:hypothetical protein NW759_011038 [Fusarium solani]
MGANVDWTGFSAFSNTLSVASLSTQQTGPTLQANVAAAAARFRDWIDDVRNNPQGHGFSNAPVNYAGAVVRLLNTFFPANARPVLFSTGNPPPAVGGQPIIQPVMVPFGAAPNVQMGIADGASALGYLFSVVSYPQNLQPTWQNYFLPLTVLYAWSVYLAYINYDPNMPLNIDAVPNMSCIMYLPRGNDPPYFFLGHTKARAATNPNDFANDKRDNMNCLHYRGGQIQAAARTGGRPPLPNLTAEVIQQMRVSFFEILPGAVGFDPIVEDFRNPVFDAFANAPGGATALRDVQQVLMDEIKNEYAALNTPMTWKPNNIASAKRYSYTRTQNEMQPAVANLITAYLANQNTQQQWIAVLKAYISPRIVVPPMLNLNPIFVPNQLVPVPPVAQQTITALATAFYTQHQVALDIKVSKVAQLCQGISTPGLVGATDVAREQKWINKFRKDITDDYGRCAETLPAYGVSNVFYPQTFVTATAGPNVRGFALETRKVGQGAAELNAFATNFDTNAMDGISQTQGSVYRLPCAQFCATMLEHVQMRDTNQKRDEYDIDMRAVPRTVVLPPA